MSISIGKIYRSELICGVVDDLFDGHVAFGRPWKKIVIGVHAEKDDIYLFTWDEHTIKMVSREAQTKKSKPFQVEGQSLLLLRSLRLRMKV